MIINYIVGGVSLGLVLGLFILHAHRERYRILTTLADEYLKSEEPHLRAFGCLLKVDATKQYLPELGLEWRELAEMWRERDVAEIRGKKLELH